MIKRLLFILLILPSLVFAGPIQQSQKSVIAALDTGGGSSPASGIYRPDGDATIGTWVDSDFETTNMYAEVNDAVTQPTAGGETTWIRNYGNATNCDLNVAEITGSITTVRVWLYATSDQGGGTDFDVNITLDGSTWQTPVTTTAGFAGDVFEWGYVDFSVSATNTTDLRVRVTGDGSSTITIDIIYIEVNPL